MNLKCPLCQTIDESREKWRQSCLKAEAEAARLTSEAHKKNILIHDIHGENMAMRQSLIDGGRVVLKEVNFEIPALRAENARLRSFVERVSKREWANAALVEEARAALDAAGKGTT